MVDKNLLPFLQFREEVLDTVPLEQEYGITLPPIYRSFISVFKPHFAHQRIKKSDGSFQSFLVEFYSSLELDEYSIDDDELGFEAFKDLREVLTDERSNQGYLNDLLFIANQGYAGGLLVGIGEHNKDQIFHNTDSTVITYMASNIFELIHKIQWIHYDFEIPPVKTSRLYKNWGEDFWRKRD